MKKLTYIISAISVLLATSCTNELETNMQEGKLSFSSINASMADLPTSRAHLEGGGKVVWDAGDKVGIFSDTQTTPMMFECTNINESNASFTSENEVSGSNFFAYYPYENTTINGNTMAYTLSNNTVYKAGTYFRQCPMIAKSTTNEFGFKHTCGIIRFSITGTKRIQSLVLEGNNGEIIAGTGTINLNAETPILAIPSDAADADKAITMTMNNLQLSSTATDFYFIVPQGEFTQGFSLTIHYLNDNSSVTPIKKVTTKSITVSRSVIKSFSAIDTDALLQEQEEERIYAALMAFYNATGGDNWTNNTNWGSDKPFNKWYGVYANGTDGKEIVWLDLQNNNLNGELPKEIGGLSSLVSINLTMNKLRGEIPVEIGNLKRLETLLVQDNQLFGQLPCELVNLHNLRTMSLAINDFDGVIPDWIGNMESLTWLQLGGNKFTGSIPESLGKLTNLSYLELLNNQLSGSIPKELTTLPNLTYLHLGWNKLSGDLSSYWGNFPVLEELHLNNNQFTGEIPKELGNVSTLKNIILSENSFSGELPKELSNLNYLESINFDCNQLTGRLPEEYMNLKNLKHLYVYGNKLNGTCSEELSEFIEDLDGYNIIQQEGYELKFYFYNSTDFSRDGEVSTLQTHSKGDGIKIVITMDAFTDKDITDGTADYYIQKAYGALFSVEPYITLKEYFDVYSVLTVSTRKKIGTETALATICSGYKFSLNYTNVEEYANKVPILSDNLSNTHILVILNNKSSLRPSCSWTSYGSISCVGTIEEANNSLNIKTAIIHEMLGHGLGKLGDEYIEEPRPGIENPYEGSFPETEKQNVWDMHKQGYYLNVDVTNDSTKIVWKDFLTNPDYTYDENNDNFYDYNQVGIYEGALLYERGAYRPNYNSIMSYDLSGYFNAPSRWAIYMNVLKAAGEEPTFEAFLKYDKKNLSADATRSVFSRSSSSTSNDKQKTGAPPCFIHR